MRINAEKVMALLHAAPEIDDPNSWPSALKALHLCNSVLWNLEESVRRRPISDSDVARIKREIDTANMQRHRVVAQLDRIFSDQFNANIAKNAPAVLNSETLGQMLDRLSVLELKRANFAAKGDIASLEKIERHIAHVSACFENALVQINNGASPPGCAELKDYGDGVSV